MAEGAPKLTDPQRYLLWTVAQHKYGWSHVTRRGGQLQVAAALVRRGLIEWVEPHNGPTSSVPEIKATEQGRAEIERRWPVSPYALCAWLEGLDLVDAAQAIRRGESSRSAVAVALESLVEQKRSFLNAQEPIGSGAMHDRLSAWCGQAEELIERSGTGKKRGEQ